METSQIVLSIHHGGLATLPRSMKRKRGRLSRGAVLGTLLAIPQGAQASIFKGETLDAVAEALSWVVLFVVPIVAIAVFWLLHIMPEKIAERRKHPQAKAIQCLCLLSLVFGGLLWPIAWLWAYTKPVLHKLAYGTDKEEHVHEEHDEHGQPEEDEEERENKRARDLRSARARPEQQRHN